MIGVTAHRLGQKDGSTPADALPGDYCAAVALAGGAPVLIPLGLGERALDEIYACLDGLLLAGGVDVAPALYGQEPHPKLGEFDHELDRVELYLARRALAEGLPILGICRGIQLLNVAAGGTLFQDIPSQVPGALAHSVTDRADAHEVTIEPGTRLAAALGDGRCVTNSRHHQAVRDVAPGMVATARTSDGVVEGIEAPGARFVVGVQWHPENLAAASPRMLGLFRAFVEACRRA